MADATDLIREELGRWAKGVLALEKPAPLSDLRALEGAIRRPLPGQYAVVLGICNGADLHGDRVFSAAEALERWQSLRTLIAPHYREDPDWNRPEPPDHLLPIAVDLEGNLKCIDLSTTGPEVVDWHRESCTFDTWHADVASWLLTCLGQLAIRFDHRGRPRPIRVGEAEGIRRREIETHLKHEPNGSWPLLELAIWTAENRPPEEALFAFRTASAATPRRAINHYMHARHAILFGRFEEARQQLRRALSVGVDPNPRKHDFRTAWLPSAHSLLSLLYERVGQPKKAEEQRRNRDRAANRYGLTNFRESPELQEILRAIDPERTT